MTDTHLVTPSTPSRQALIASSSAEAPERSLNRQIVLEEDEYTAALSHIIARDFFPSLVHLDATNNYLDALRSDDATLINASVRRLQELDTPQHVRPLQTPSHTPWGGGPTDTPLRTPMDVDGTRPLKRTRYDMDMSLDDFQAQYTSEDNSSFTQILDTENQRRKEKWGWAWQAQKRVEEQRGKLLERREKLLIEGSMGGPGVREKFRIEQPTPAGLITAGPDEQRGEVEEGEKNDDAEEKDKNEMQVTLSTRYDVETTDDDGKPVDVMAPKKDTRPAGVDGWAFKTRNNFMFAADADATPYDRIPSSTDARHPKVIKHGNTRLPEQETKSRGRSEPPSPTQSRINAAIAGTPYRPRSPSDDSFSLLPTMPSPTPSELGPTAVKQLMTWGTLNATPRVLPQSDDPADLPPSDTPFHLPVPSNREEISRRLSLGASKSLRVKAAMMNGAPPSRTPGSNRGGGGGLMLPPTWTPRRVDAVGSLTPAGRRILDRTTAGVAGSRRAEAMGKMSGWESSAKVKERDFNRVRWTPSPNPVTRKHL